PAHADLPWPGFGLGIYAWTLQTYLRLTAAGLPCQLVPGLPEEGVVFVHSNVLQAERVFQPSPKRLIVSFKADVLPGATAQIQVVQNPQEADARTHCYWLPHWPQPGLQPRHPQRGNQLQNVAFFGHINNLADELASLDWKAALADLGLCWWPRLSGHHWSQQVDLPSNWHDYQEVDVIVAVRSFQVTDIRRTRNYGNKPATKLYNAWLAGVPAILGSESAYRAERQSDLDFLEVNSLDDVLVALRRLQNEQGLYKAMVTNGLERAKAVSPEAIATRWLTFIETVVMPAYDCWRTQSQWQRTWQVGQQQLTATRARIERKVRSHLFPA
ncbi:MAG TPA: hypothetical protein V6D07_17285, partial [Trichocoleus sp.]